MAKSHASATLPEDALGTHLSMRTLFASDNPLGGQLKSRTLMDAFGLYSECAGNSKLAPCVVPARVPRAAHRNRRLTFSSDV
eukprot:6475863-Amphidinium_carterae.3